MIGTHGKRIDPDQPGSYEWYTLGQPFTGPWGYNHCPTDEQLASVGYMPLVGCECDYDTQKQTDDLTDDGAAIRPVVVGLTPEEQAASLAVKQATAWERIKAERDRRTQTGGYRVASVNKWFHSDTFSRTQQIGLTMMGASLPPGKYWKTMDGSFVELTPALVGEIFQAGAAMDMAVFGVAESHRQMMLQAAAPSAYDFSGGWPVVFGESA